MFVFKPWPKQKAQNSWDSFAAMKALPPGQPQKLFSVTGWCFCIDCLQHNYSCLMEIYFLKFCQFHVHTKAIASLFIRMAKHVCTLQCGEVMRRWLTFWWRLGLMSTFLIQSVPHFFDCLSVLQSVPHFPSVCLSVLQSVPHFPSVCTPVSTTLPICLFVCTPVSTTLPICLYSSQYHTSHLSVSTPVSTTLPICLSVSTPISTTLPICLSLLHAVCTAHSASVLLYVRLSTTLLYSVHVCQWTCAS